MIKVSDHWLGTESSLAHIIEANQAYQLNPALYPPRILPRKARYAPSQSAKINAAMGPGSREEEDDDEEEEDDGLIMIDGDIGILNVNGPLVAEDSWLNSFFGITSYPAIARSAIKLAEMYQDGEISQIIHVFSTPGGDANGINGVSEVLQACKDLAPNTVSYTGSTALSAGYWLATINDKLYVDKMGEVGSIGVISTIKSISRMLEADGVDVKVVRSGKYKALLHPYEPISEAGLKEVEAKGAQLHGFFIEHIQSMRPKLSSRVTQWGEGQTFFGEEAVQLGLADGPPMSLNTLVKNLKSRQNTPQRSGDGRRDHGDDDQDESAFTYRGTPMPRKVVVFESEADRAMVAAGVDLNAVPHEEVEDDDLPEAAVELASAVDDTTLITELAQQPLAPAEPELARYLRDELAASRKELATLQLQLSQLEQAKQELSAVEAQLAPIAREAIQRLQVALRQKPTTLAGLPASVLAAQYAEVKTEFERVMPVGAKALSGSDTSREPVDAGEQRLFLVR